MTSLINYGMVGGGEDAFIGNIPRIAESIDNHYHLVGGASPLIQSVRYASETPTRLKRASRSKSLLRAPA